MIRVAAVGDIHAGTEHRGRLAPHFAHLEGCADVLLLAGDLTRCGDPEEAQVVADELGTAPVPVIAVLGNHDHHAGAAQEVRAVLSAGGITVLEGESTVVEVDGMSVGVAGVKGFGGGFAGASGSEFGEPEMKAFMAHSRTVAEDLDRALGGLETDVRIALTHYSPVEETLRGERLEIYPFLGSYLLAQAIDRHPVDLAVHGHAHRGTERGLTPAGVRVRNVAQPVIQHTYRIYRLLDGAGDEAA